MTWLMGSRPFRGNSQIVCQDLHSLHDTAHATLPPYGSRGTSHVPKRLFCSYVQQNENFNTVFVNKTRYRGLVKKRAG